MCYWPATSILTCHIVSQPDRTRYFSSRPNALDPLTKVATPLVAAGLLAFLIPLQRVFLLSAMLTAACAWLIGSTRARKILLSHAKEKQVDEIRKTFLLDLESIRSLPEALIASILLGIGVSLTPAVYDPHLAAFLSYSNFDVSAFSFLLSAIAAGTVTGALLVRFRLSRLPPGALMRTGIACFAAALSCAAMVAAIQGRGFHVLSLAAIWLFNGLGYEIFVIGSNVNMQNLCLPGRLGRISKATRSLQMLAAVMGPGISAWFISAHSREAPFIVAAVASLFLLVGTLAEFRKPPSSSIEDTSKQGN